MGIARAVDAGSRWFGLVVCLAARVAIAEEPLPCPAEAQPGWSSASAVEKREQVRRCRELEPSLAPAWTPKPDESKPWSTSARVAVSAALFVPVAAAAFAPAGLLARGIPFPLGGLALYAGLSAVLATSTVVFIGNLARTKGDFGASLLGAAGGAAVAMLIGLAVSAAAPTGQELLVTSLILGGLLPLAGALIGYQLSLKPAVEAIIMPTPGSGAQLLFGMRW